MLSKMVGNSRSELAGSSPEGPSFTAAYPNGQRGSYSGASLDRSGSFRENIDSRGLSSGAGATRSPASVTPTETPSPSQYLMLEPLSLGEQRYPRAGELRRVLGISLEDHSFGAVQSRPLTPAVAEELKRFKASVSESTTRARERARVLQESITKLERYRNIASRKRQRSDIPSGEKSGGANLLKMGSQIHQNPSELAAQRLEERSKNVVPNKRMRSSVMADVRAEGRSTVPLRQGPALEKDKNTLQEKDKNMLRACNGGLMHVEDKIRALPAGGEGWDKKMKRKRSVGPVVTRPIDGDREFKPALQQRISIESRVRPSDGLGFRPGASSGVVGTNKNDTSSQVNGASTRTITKNDFENVSLPNDRRERSGGPDKERSLAKGGNKIPIREDTQIGSQSPLTKGKASRGPRTGSSAAMNSSSSFPRPSGGTDGWDQPSSLNKVQPLSGANNRKSSLPTVTSSPPVTQWMNQRPPKNTRKRRTSLVSPVPNHDEAPVLSEGFPPDVGARTITEASGLMLSRGLTSAQQLKLKPENVPSPTAVSESEESGAAENRSKDKGAHAYEVEDGAVSGLQKGTALMIPSKKSKAPSREEIGDGVRRQGRSGRGSSQPKSVVPSSKEKLESIDSMRPVRTGRPASEISKVGRPPSKKMSDRKAYARPAHAINSGSSDLIGEQDDDRDELLLAADSARNASSQSCSSSAFWKKMEQVFSFVCEDDISYLKQQISFVEEINRSFCSMLDSDFSGMTVVPGDKHAVSDLVGIESSMGIVTSVDESRQVDAESGKMEGDRWLENIFPLSQRLLAAFIEEDESEMYDCDIGHEDIVHSASDYSSHVTTSHVSFEAKDADRIESEYESELTFMTRKNCSRDNSCNGYSVSSNFRSPDMQTVSYSNELFQENNFLHHGGRSEYGQDNNERTSTMGSDVSGSPYECQYEHRCLDDKILIELQSIGLFLDTVPNLAEGEDDELDRDLSALKMKLYEQMRRKKGHLCQLDKAIQNAKEANERKLEQIAMDKLVEMAYKKYLGGRGNHGSSHKSGANKISKQVALSFAERVLARCRKFEETRLSCFSEPTFRDCLFSPPPHRSDAKLFDSARPATASNACSDVRNCQQGNRLAASGVMASMAEPVGLKVEPDFCKRLTSLSDQTFTKQEPITNRGKKKEVLLDDVGGTTSRTVTVISNSLPGGAKGKRSERDRDQNMLMRNSVPKPGRPSLSSGRGERKTKMKPKQKTAQLSTSGNGLLGRFTEATSTVSSMRESSEIMNSGNNRGNESLYSGRNASSSSKGAEETIDFTSLPLDSIELDVGADLGGQGQDIGSWLSVDDDALQDNDLIMGLEIPMDDLSELNMNF